MANNNSINGNNNVLVKAVNSAEVELGKLVNDFYTYSCVGKDLTTCSDAELEAHDDFISTLILKLEKIVEPIEPLLKQLKVEKNACSKARQLSFVHEQYVDSDGTSVDYLYEEKTERKYHSDVIAKESGVVVTKTVSGNVDPYSKASVRIIPKKVDAYVASGELSSACYTDVTYQQGVFNFMAKPTDEEDK